jgi:hypothetical protein
MSEASPALAAVLYPSKLLEGLSMFAAFLVGMTALAAVGHVVRATVQRVSEWRGSDD